MPKMGNAIWNVVQFKYIVVVVTVDVNGTRSAIENPIETERLLLYRVNTEKQFDRPTEQ